jgi:hypothetical protein
MMMEVRPCISLASAAWISASVSVSTLEVASSSTSRISGLVAMARAKASSCFCTHPSFTRTAMEAVDGRTGDART